MFSSTAFQKKVSVDSAVWIF